MTVRVERTFDISVEPERVWEFIADPAKRAGAISVVEDFDIHGDGRATWHLSLPIRLLGTISVETEEIERDPPESVKFVGRSRVLDVTGEHRLEPTVKGTRLVNRFTVDGHFPGVERFFERNIDREFTNLKEALEADLGVEV